MQEQRFKIEFGNWLVIWVSMTQQKVTHRVREKMDLNNEIDRIHQFTKKYSKLGQDRMVKMTS